MKYLILIVVLITAPLLMGAAPGESGYGHVPKKSEAIQGNEGLTEIREESVKPEEVYKNGVQEFSIIASDSGYFPTRIYARANIPVKVYLTNVSERTYCFMLDDFSIRKGIAPQKVEEVRFLPTKAGEYRFLCPVPNNEDRIIEGKVVIRD